MPSFLRPTSGYPHRTLLERRRARCTPRSPPQPPPAHTPDHDGAPRPEFATRPSVGSVPPSPRNCTLTGLMQPRSSTECAKITHRDRTARPMHSHRHPRRCRTHPPLPSAASTTGTVALSDPHRLGGACAPDFGAVHPTSATNSQVTRQEEGEFALQLHMRGANATVPPGETRRVGS